MGILAFSGFLNRLIRVDPPISQGRATVRLVWEALDKEATTETVERMTYLLKELEIGHEIFARWTERMVNYLIQRATQQTLPDVHAATMQPWLTTTTEPYLPAMAGRRPRLEISGENVSYKWLNDTIEVRVYRQADTYPLEVLVDGERYAPVHKLDDSLREAIAKNDVPAARQGIDRALVRNRLVHEIYCDWCWALLTRIREVFGEEQFGRAMRATMEDWITIRYKDMVEMSPEELLQLTVEGLRGEFFGSELLGDVQVTEEQDRYVLSFDPCGTGGRMRRGVPQLGTPPRTQPPYNFGVSYEPHDWSWNEKGVCLYCTHCADINELLPLDRVGHPMRVTEHPKDPGDKCRWFIYKKPELIPAKYYERLGRKRPAHFIPLEEARADEHAKLNREENRQP